MTYLLRVNLDIEEKHPEKYFRFCKALETIKKLKKSGDKIVILSHLGRPKGFEAKLSLKCFQRPLEKELSSKVIFLGLGNFADSKKKIEASPRGTVFLLENLRFEKSERLNGIKFARELASLGDLYINDDFATSHRENASNVGILKFISGLPGPNLSLEIKTLRQVIKHPQKPFVLIVGGVKMTDKIEVIENLFPRADFVLLGGGPANTFLKAKGENVGESLFNKEMVAEVKKLLRQKKIILPVDSVKFKGKNLDIGPMTSRQYSEVIRKAKTIIWGGPMGFFEKPRFSEGTKAIWKAILKNKEAKVVIGGGETVASLKLLKANEANKLIKLRSNVFLSTGGGAMLEFLAGKKLPALVALKLQKK